MSRNEDQEGGECACAHSGVWRTPLQTLYYTLLGGWVFTQVIRHFLCLRLGICGKTILTEMWNLNMEIEGKSQE